MTIKKGQWLDNDTQDVLYPQTSYDMVEGAIPQDNLLTNSDFRSGIINQKGETSYSYSGTGGKLTIDMWISYGVNVGIEMDTIRIINRDTTEHTLRQKMSKAYPNQVYTVAVQVASVTGDVYINFNNETATNQKLKVGLNVFQITPVSTFGEFSFLLKANAEIKFNYAKVEPGSFFTGMPLWNKAIELLKCMGYSQKLYRTTIYTTSASGVTYFIPKGLYIPMINKPKIELIEILNSSAQPQSVTIKSSVVEKDGVVNITLSGSIGQYGYITCYFDGNNY